MFKLVRKFLGKKRKSFFVQKELFTKAKCNIKKVMLLNNISIVILQFLKLFHLISFMSTCGQEKLGLPKSVNHYLKCVLFIPINKRSLKVVTTTIIGYSSRKTKMLSNQTIIKTHYSLSRRLRFQPSNHVNINNKRYLILVNLIKFYGRSEIHKYTLFTVNHKLTGNISNRTISKY